MADSDKNIVIVPNRGATGQPSISFTGQGNDPIVAYVLDGTPGALSIEGSAGQLFSITNNLTSGSIFSVNDVSGIPSLDINADGTVSIASFGGNVGVGLTNPSQKLDVSGSIRASSQLISTIATGTAPLSVSSTTLVTNLNADLLDGINSTSFVYDRGQFSIGIASSWDLIEPGMYGVSSASAFTGTNNPESTISGIYRYGVMTVLESNGAGIAQLYTPHTGNKIALRTGWSNGNWYGWQQIWTNTSDGAGSGLDADLLDGINSTQFVRNDVLNEQVSSYLTINSDNGFSVLELEDASNVQRVHVYHANASNYFGIGVFDTAGSNRKDLILNQSGAITWNLSTIWTAGNDGVGSGLDADVLDGQQGSYYTNASNINAGTLNDARLSYTELGRSPVGNFGQWAGHLAYTDFNTPPAYWGWTYLNGTTNAPNGSSAQWYRGRFSLGDAYGLGSDTGDYWMEMAIPRYSQGGAPGNLWIRTCENGVEQSWHQVAATISGNTSWHAGNDGPGSGLDADTLDTIQASSFLRSDADDSFSGIITNSGNFISSNSEISAAGFDKIRLGRSNSQYMSFWGDAGGNGMASISQTSNPKGNLRLAYSIDGGVTLENTYSFTGSSGTVWTTGNDGSGSGLDADTLDGIDSGSFLRSDADDSFSGTITGTSGSSAPSLIIDGNGPNIIRFLDQGSSNLGIDLVFRTTPNTLGFEKSTDGTNLWETDCDTGVTNFNYNPTVSGNTIWHAGNDGTGSGLDADLLDGINSSQFIRTDVDTTVSQTFGPRFGHTNQTDGNDGFIAAGKFSSGLNIVGTQTTAGTGRQVRIWGTVIDSVGNGYWHGGNDGAGSGLDADLLDGKNTGTSGNTIPLLDGTNTWSNTQTFSSRIIAANTFDVNGSSAGGQADGLYVADLGATVGTTLNPTFTAAICAQLSVNRSIALTVDPLGYLWGFRSHSTTPSTYTFTSRTVNSDTLTTTRSIWGQNFNGSANITGALSGATTITASSTIQGTQFISTVATGTAPLSVTSTTLVTNLNADLLDSIDSGSFLRSDTADTATGLLTLSGGVIVDGSIDSGGSNYAGYRSTGTNIILKGNASGVSGIFFQSEKDGTNINHPSDYGYIQFHAYGIDGSSGENNKLVIGVANDSGDTVVLQSPYKDGVKISFRDSTNGTGGTEYTVWHAGNDGVGSGLDADVLDGEDLVDSAATANTVVGRNGSGDIFARLIRQTYQDQSTISGGIVYRINNSNDNYLRVCNDTGAIRTFLNVPTRTGGDASGTWGINITGNAATVTDGLYTNTTFGGDVSGTYNAIVVADDSHSHAFDNLTGKTSGTGDYATTGDIVSGKGSGGVALTINDGKGNANVTFNHQDGVPEQTGNAARIEVNTDSVNNAAIYFEGKSNVSGGTSVDLNNWFTMSDSGATCLGNTVWHSGNDGSGSGLDADLLDGLNAASTNTASTIVARDGSGNFSAGTITAALSGNATTATTLATTRTIWGQNFNGGANVTGNLTSVGDITGTGAITISAGGTNQNITLTPSGTGTINAPTFNATSTTNGGFQGIATDTVNVPSFTWTGDLTTGIYRPGTNEVGITLAGTNRATFAPDLITFRRTNTDPDSTANSSFTIDYNLSGSTTLTANRSKNGFYIDLDHSSTGGTTTNGQRETIYGMTSDVDTSGTPNGAYGVYGTARSNNTTGTITSLVGVRGYAEGDSGVGGTTTSVYGVQGDARDGGAGTVSNVYGAQFYVLKETAATATLNNAVAMRAEVEIDGNTITTTKAGEFVIDIDGGTLTNAYLTWGAYEGTIQDGCWNLYYPSNAPSYVNGEFRLGANTDLGGEKLQVTGDARITGSCSANTLISTVATGTAPLTVSSTTLVTNLNADLLDGENLVDNAGTASTVAGRDINGDIHVRLIRQTFGDQATISGGIVYRINNSTDNFLRVCNDTGAIRTFLDVPTRTGGNASGTWGISITGNADTATTLATTRTIWGQSFNGGGNVSGNLTSVGDITGTGAITISAGGTNQSITLTPSGTGTVNAPTFNATSTTSGGFQGIDADSASAPSFTWTSDLNTGMYRVGTDVIGFTAGGALVTSISTTNMFHRQDLYITNNLDTGATSGTTTIDSEKLYFRGKYWNGTSSQNGEWAIFNDMDGTGPNSKLTFTWQNLIKLTIDEDGIVSAPGTGSFSGSLSGNASSATRLFNLNTIWGQTFDGTASVSGNLTSVGNITGTGAVTLTATSAALNLSATGSNNVIINTNSTQRLHIDSSGRALLSSITTARTNLGFAGGASANLQIEGTDGDTSRAIIMRNDTSTGGSDLWLAKSGGSAIGSNTVVPANSLLGTITFAGATGTYIQASSYISSSAEGTPSTGFLPANLTFGTRAGGSSVVERMRITSSGFVGISTTDPTSELDVLGTITASGIKIYDGSTYYQNIAIGTITADRTLTLANGNTTLVGGTMVATTRSITISGGTGITSSAGAQNLSANRTWTLSVDSTVIRTTGNYTQDGELVIKNGTGSGLIYYRRDAASANNKEWRAGCNNDNSFIIQALDDAGSGSGLYFRFIRSGNAVNRLDFMNGIDGWGTIRNDTARMGLGTLSPGYRLDLPNTASVEGRGRSNQWVVHSDGRIKSDRQTIPYGLDTVMSLTPIKYFQHNSKTDDEGNLIISENEGDYSIGLIAQDVENIVPEVVTAPENPEKDLYALDYSKLTTVLIKAVQEQQAMIEELRAEIEALKSS
jgi:hypothetical protein